MIYFLDNSLQLQKIVTSKNTGDIMHHEELNGLIHGNVELDLFYANKFLILGIDHVGYYYKDEFYLHKIQRVEYDHVNESVKVVFRHIFFEDMLFGPIIKDVRPKNQDAVTILRQTIEANTRWQIVMTDVTGTLSTNFYWQVPYEVIEFVNKNFRVDMFPKILFDGKNINGFQLHVKNASSSEVKQRIPFGSRVLDLKYEEDFSEVVTKLVGHGKGEEVGDGYGRRINFSEINFNRNGVKSPVGSVYMEDASVTNTYGNDGQTPREGRVVFEDIESPSELAEATYQHYLDVSRPQMLFTADVANIGDVNIGDSVLIVRREYDVYFKARIHKLSVNLLNPEDAQVELGDYEHFKESKVERKSREKNNRVQKQLSDRIARLKREANDFIDGEFSQAISEFEQNLIDQKAQIEADRENMTNLIEGTRTEFTDNLNAEIAQTKEYAEQQAQAKAEAVRTDLETVTSGHQTMLQELEANVINIDDFIGPRDRTLQSILDNQREELEQKIEIYNKNYPNLVVGSTLENIDGFEPYQTTEIELRTEESLNYIRTYDVEGRNTLAYYFPDTVYLEQGNTYTIGVDFRSDSVEDLDYIYFMGPYNNVALTPLAQTRGLTADGTWHRYYFTFVWVDTTRHARLMIGTLLTQGSTQRGWFDTRQVHIYKGDVHNIPWSPSPSDNAQIVSQLLYEMRQLEDGMSTLATKTEVDLLTGDVTQLTNEYLSTSEQVSSKLQNLDDVLGVNGSHFTQIADQVQSKVWMNDFTDINPNLIPFSDVRNLSDMSEYWSRFGANPTGSHAIALDSDGFYVFRDTVAESNLALESSTFEEIKEGEQYTLSFLAKTHSNINDNYNYTYIINPSGSNHHLGMWTNRKHIKDNIYQYEWIFEARWTGEARVLIGSTTTAGTDTSIRFKEPKLERGITRTPFLNAFSNIEQLANKIALQVQDLDGEYLSESDLQITPNYWQLGATRIGAENVSSVLRGSPEALDAVVSNFNLTGNLNANGQITSLAVDAIEGNFARLFANQLTANVITADHIQVGTSLIDKLFATSARIDQLITKTHFVNEMHALTLNVVDLNASEIRTRLLSANTIEASWIKSGTALLDRVFSSTAMFERMMAKSGFVTTLNTVTIDTDQLTIRRPDGVAWVSQGLARGHVPVQIFDNYADSSVQFSGLNFVTSSSFWKNFKYFYTPHEGSRLRVVWAVSLQTGNSASEYIEVGVSGFGNYNPISNGAGSSTRRQLVYAGQTEYITQDIPLPPPNFQTFQANLQFRRSPTGVHLDNRVTARILHIGQYD